MIHKNIGNFMDNRLIRVVGDGIFIYIKALCSPDLDCQLDEVNTMDKNVTCDKCLEMMVAPPVTDRHSG